MQVCDFWSGNEGLVANKELNCDISLQEGESAASFVYKRLRWRNAASDLYLCTYFHYSAEI